MNFDKKIIKEFIKIVIRNMLKDNWEIIKNSNINMSIHNFLNKY